MSDGRVSFTVDGEIAEILLDRPAKLNALTTAMLDQLEQAVRALDGMKDVRAVVLASAGERAFCVGADITAWAACEPLDMWRSWTKRGHQVFDQLAALRQPVVAAIQGPALGGGLELLLAADLRVAEAQTVFGLPETGIAACPGWSGSQRLNRLINPSVIKEMALAGRQLDAARALALGLVNQVCAKGESRAEAWALAREIAARAPISVQIAKQLIDAGAGERVPAVLEGLAGGLAATTQDAREGVASFKERRPPVYRGR